MSRPVRRKDRLLPWVEARDLLERDEWGVLSTVGNDGQPYGVPLSYAIGDGVLYFHAARIGRKIDNLSSECRVSFCVVGKTEPVFEKNFSTYYESVIVFGVVRNVVDAVEKTDALRKLAERYLPAYADRADAYIQKSFAATRVLALSIDTISGKAKRRKPGAA